MKRLAPAALAAALLVLAHPPFGLWPLALAALVPLARLAESPGPARRLLLPAYAGGALLFLGGCFWLAESSPVNLVLMTLVEAAALPLFLVLYRGVVRGGAPRPLALALAWTAVEYVRSHVPWNGFPWLLLGTPLAGFLPLAQAADLAGTCGLSFAAALVNGWLCPALAPRAAGGGRRRLGGLLAAAGALLALSIYGALRMQQVGDGGPGPRVAAVQANVAQRLKQRPRSVEEVVAMQLEATLPALEQAARGGGLDLLCWAETMLAGGLLHGDSEDVARIDREAVGEPFIRRDLLPLGAAFLTGVVTHERQADGTERRYNSALLFTSEGRRSHAYAKSILVPGGEFIPLRWIAPDLFDRAVRSMTGGFLPDIAAGDGPQVFTFAARDGRTYRFAPTICYENCYAAYGARAARPGVDFLVNLSNEAWFGRSAEFDQMDLISRLRAIEARRSLLRVTNSGMTALYDACGRRLDVVRGPGGEDRAVRGFLLADVPIFAVRSLFVSWGDLPAFLLTAAAAAWFLAGALRGASRGAGYLPGRSP